ncbi:MAG: hypothetical protein CBE46_000550 [Candidatus Pelagibacter sp. TMED286]|nr:MAG: hypothetical protein CBE46_000550 [Candidatus Pelagibacter sp. TMED286]
MEKKKLRIYQLIFLFVGIIIIVFTYINKNDSNQNEIISKNLQKKIEKQIENQKINNENVFYNVKYSGLDLEGRRYSIIAEQGTNSESNPNIVKMKGVNATFYFEDDTVLIIASEKGAYNNSTLDIIFENNVKASYDNSELYAEKAEFSNSKNFLIVSKNVKIIDNKGSMIADKLLFDIKDKTLNITAKEGKMVKSKVNY